MGVFAELILG